MFYDSFDKKDNFLRSFQARNLYPKMISLATNGFNGKICNVLEIGYGRGEFHKIFMQIYPDARYFVVDANKSICDDALNNGAVAAYQAFLPDFPDELLNERVDLVIMNNILEHLNCWQDIEKVLVEKLKPLLSPDGRVVIFVPDYLDCGKDYFDVDYSHTYICTRARMNKIAQDCGYRVVKNDYFRSAFNNFRIFFWALSKINKLVFGFILHITGNMWRRTFLYKCKIAFNRCVFLVIEKDK